MLQHGPSVVHAVRNAPELALAGYGFLVNLGWEFAQTPLYADVNGRPGYLLWTRLHCTLGDVIILCAAFWMTSLIWWKRSWWKAPQPGTVLTFVGIGLAYTIFSEWYNTTVLGSWAYAPRMPLILGIGLSPLLQWIVIPPLVLRLIRMRRAGTDQ